MSKADLTKDPDDVAAMFDAVATGYDRTNAVLSLGNSALWRIVTARTVDPQPGQVILDVAAGTGTSSAAFAKNGARVVAADFSEGMLALGRVRHENNPFIEFAQADATELPFDDAAFDTVTISFGLRNVVQPRKALAEFHRVLKPGGRLVVCEFSHPQFAPLSAAYRAYLRLAMPLLVRISSSDPEAYDYLMDSIVDWPAQPELAEWLREAGLTKVAYRNLTGGIVALHRGVKPSPADSPDTSATAKES